MNENRVRSCAYTIADNLKSILNELQTEKPYPGYIHAKAEPILNDIQVILEECNMEK